MQIKIKKLHENAVTPQKAHENDAGFDLVAVTKKQSNGFLELGTGLSFELPPGTVGYLFPRSSISKKNMLLSNSVGVLDNNFRGEVTFRFKPSTIGKGSYDLGDKIGQLIVMPIPAVEIVEVEELGDTERGSGSYGSSDVG